MRDLLQRMRPLFTTAKNSRQKQQEKQEQPMIDTSADEHEAGTSDYHSAKSGKQSLSQQHPSLSPTVGDSSDSTASTPDSPKEGMAGPTQPCVPPLVDTTENSIVSDGLSEEATDYDFTQDGKSQGSFLLFRLSYLFVTLVIMLADGLQGTHLYVLYEGYGFSVASLYCLGFITGAVTAPITGPLIDKIGRKRAALLYCGLEVAINMLEQFPFLAGLVVSRVVGGITTNLLSTVFEAWVDTEYRNRGFAAEQYETLMRDSVIISNLAAIASGYLAHILAEALGPVGPFEGAVTCTAVAFAVVLALWTENYGNLGKEGSSKTSWSELKDTIDTIRSDSRILRVCLTQGLSMGSLHIFIFLWAPVLKEFATTAGAGIYGLDGQGEPAYGLIFGAFMAAGVFGGLISPFFRRLITFLLSPLTSAVPQVINVEGEGEVRSMAVEFQGALCYFLCSMVLMVPCVLSTGEMGSFTTALSAFVVYEILVGIYSPCEGVIRSLYMPPDSRGSMMTIPRIIVNVAVALGVVSTELVSHQTALAVISILMFTSGILQMSLVSRKELVSLFGRIEQSVEMTRSASMSVMSAMASPATTTLRRISSGGMPSAPDLDKKED